MATITSAQSGNFSSTSTWVGGVVPVDGDSFVIATGHTVIYDVSTPVVNGFNDSTINGILQTAAGISTTLRMNGRLQVRTAGTYHARAGHTLQFRGTAASSHILYQYAEAGTGIIMEGSDGMPVTTLSATANERSTSLSFTNATNFAIGEWFAVYNNTTASGNAGATTLQDEGFWIHDISGNTVYFRQYVGPESTITSGTGTSLVVANSKVFRAGQIIIFGTGANRNIHTITSINYSTHTLTLSGTITGTVVGLSVYETGSDKIHESGQKVRKVATVTTASSTSSSTIITVANANMFTAGDDIWIEARSECGGSTDYTYSAYGNETPGPRYKHTISSVSTNTITLTAAVGYNVVQGALVTRLTRDVVVEPVTPNTDYYGVYIPSYTTNYSNKLILKDVYFKYAGSSYGQPEGGIYIHGYHSANSLPVTLTEQVPAYSNQPWIEGVSMTGSNSTRDWGGFWTLARYNQIRCGVVVGRFNSSYGLYYREGHCLYNSIAVGSDNWGIRVEGATEWGEVAYNYASRCYRSTRQKTYDSSLGTHHLILDSSEYSAYTAGYSSAVSNYKIIMTGTRRGIVTEDGPYIHIYSQLNYLSGYSSDLTNQMRGWYHSGHIDRGHNSAWYTSVEHNLEYDALYQETYGTSRTWDNVEGAWRVYNASDFSDYGVGWFESVFIPANVTTTVQCQIKLAPSYSGNYPRLEYRDVVQGVTPNRVGNSGGDWSSWVAGGAVSTQYTAAAANGYEAKELTISAKPFPRYINIGVHVDSSNASEGYWMTDIIVIMDTPYAVSRFATINSGISGQAGVIERTIPTGTKIRIGGRLN